MARHAFALAQLAEKIERQGEARKFAPQSASVRPLGRYRALIPRTISDGFRSLSVTWATIAGGRAGARTGKDESDRRI